MKAGNKAPSVKAKKAAALTIVKPPLPRYKLPFPRPICLEKCNMAMPRGYEGYILMTLKAFGNETAFNKKIPHKLKGNSKDIWSLDIKSRDDKYRMLYYHENGVCKIINLCTDTH